MKKAGDQSILCSEDPVRMEDRMGMLVIIDGSGNMNDCLRHWKEDWNVGDNYDNDSG